MADVKRIAIIILKGIGKFFYYIGLGIYRTLRWTGRKIQEHDRRVAYEESIRAEQRRRDAQIYHDAYVMGRAQADAELDARDVRRIARQQEADARYNMRRLEAFVWGEPEPKRKRRK